MAAVSATPVHQRTVGIDLAISAVQVAQIFNDGHAAGKALRFRLTAADLTRFVATVKDGAGPATPITAVMEPTGMAWFPVALWLQRAGVRVIRVKGQRVQALRKYLSEHAKTDATDARVLGAMPRFGEHGMDPVYVPDIAHHVLQRLTKQRHRYQDMVSASRRRLLDLIRWACPALEAVLPDTVTRMSLAILGELFDPHKVLAMRRDVLARFLAKHAAGDQPKAGPFIDDLVVKLKAAAHETVALYGTAVDFDALQFEVAQEVGLIRMWQSHMAALEARIQVLYTSAHPSDALRSIPGIAATLAPLLVGVLGDIGRFRNQTHIRGFCGLFPTRSASGTTEKPGQHLTKSGNDRIKRALYLAADTARKIDPDLAAVYWRLMVHKGHHHKQALCAVATRLVNRIYRVLKTGRTYVLRDLEGHPISVRQAKAIVAERFTVPLELRRARCKQPAIVGT
ncbi:MAG: IS110 family transposase [Rhodanobacteraceae bacterium]